MAPRVHSTATTSTIRLSSYEIVKRRRRKNPKTLFGIPNKDRVDEWLREREEQHVTEAAKRWDFDFEHGTPKKNDPKNAFEYKKVDKNEVPKFFQNLRSRRTTDRKTPGRDERNNPVANRNDRQNNAKLRRSR
ncbi:hypothetical protein M3Y95_01174800 [Aphelenchoides besseyi]|nr:hypothetical protein M3Y95_01174800 [Aphelenchoides besseyi]